MKRNEQPHFNKKQAEKLDMGPETKYTVQMFIKCIV